MNGFYQNSYAVLSLLVKMYLKCQVVVFLDQKISEKYQDLVRFNLCNINHCIGKFVFLNLMS